jgi:hypothetical protein
MQVNITEEAKNLINAVPVPRAQWLKCESSRTVSLINGDAR